MLLPASYANGFAPRDGSPLYPELWKGCVGAWNPGLGVSGLTLRDWSGFQNTGVLTNGPTWGVSRGRYAISFDGSDDFVDIANTGTRIASNDNHAISIWFAINSFTNSPILYTWTTPVSLNDFGFVEFNATGTQIFWGVRNTGAAQTGSRAYTVTAMGNTLHHLLLQKTGAGNSGNLYLDGVLQPTFTGTLYNTPASMSQLLLGKYVSAGYHTNGAIVDCAVFSSNVERHVSLLSSRPGIAYEMAPRRRASVQVTTNRRRRIIIGGNR